MLSSTSSIWLQFARLRPSLFWSIITGHFSYALDWPSLNWEDIEVRTRFGYHNSSAQTSFHAASVAHDSSYRPELNLRYWELVSFMRTCYMDDFKASIDCKTWKTNCCTWSLQTGFVLDCASYASASGALYTQQFLAYGACIGNLHTLYVSLHESIKHATWAPRP